MYVLILICLHDHQSFSESVVGKFLATSARELWYTGSLLWPSLDHHVKCVSWVFMPLLRCLAGNILPGRMGHEMQWRIGTNWLLVKRLNVWQHEAIGKDSVFPGIYKNFGSLVHKQSRQLSSGSHFSLKRVSIKTGQPQTLLLTL